MRQSAPVSLIPPHYTDCVVALGADDPRGEVRWLASGFFYAFPRGNLADGERTYAVCLVTNRHVFEGLRRIHVRLDPGPASPIFEFSLDLADRAGPIMVTSEQNDVDVAIIPVNYRQLREQGLPIGAFVQGRHSATTERLAKEGLAEGDPVFLLGYPMWITQGFRHTVLVRGGTVARLREALAGASDTYLVDATIFPGNSGGPVVARPDMRAIQGTGGCRAAYLMGLVRSYLPYEDLAVSQQTGMPRVIFQENSGLVVVHTMDVVDETIRLRLDAAAFVEVPAGDLLSPPDPSP